MFLPTCSFASNTTTKIRPDKTTLLLVRLSLSCADDGVEIFDDESYNFVICGSESH